MHCKKYPKLHALQCKGKFTTTQSTHLQHIARRYKIHFLSVFFYLPWN